MSGVAPLEVHFTGDQSTARAGGAVMRYTWDFGDGATDTLAPNPAHTYTDPGLYEVVLRAEDDKGGIGVARQLITVRPGEHQPPLAVAQVSAHLLKLGDAVHCSAADSTCADGSAPTCHWDFGDGQQADGVTVSHSYAAAGRYLIKLSVTNASGQRAQASAFMKVDGEHPEPVFPLRQGARVLLIGNSLIDFSGPIDEWLTFYDKIAPQPIGLHCESRGKGLGKLVEYATWTSLGIHDKIAQGWDVVIIQPWIDATDAKVSDADLLKDAKTLVDWAREVGAYPVFYEPQFGWPNLLKDQAYGYQRIKQLADTLDTGLIPAGQAWPLLLKDYPLKLDAGGRPTTGTDMSTLHPYMYSDFGHQSFNGSLLNSLMIWKYLTGQSPLTVKVTADTPGLNPEAKQRIIWDRVPYLAKLADDSIVPASEKVR